MVEPRTLPGFMELLPQDQILFNKIKSVIAKNYEKYGFLPLDTPVLESSEVLLAKAGGETEKQIYSFSKGDNNLCMRFDLTVPLAKYVASNINQLNFPFQRYQIGKVYRGERPQKGRFREFYQCDIDVVGKEELSLYYDAEIPSIIYNVFKELDVGDFTIYISNRKILIGLLQYLDLDNRLEDILRLIDKLDKIGQEKFVLSLKEDLNIEQEKINDILKVISCKGNWQEQINALRLMNISNDVFKLGIEELEFVAKNMKNFGVDEKNYNINLALARGLDYYTGTIYETYINGYEGLGSVSSGGRYDNLAGYYTNTKLPGVGMSIGLTRLFCKLKENNMIQSSQNSISKAVILPMSQNTITQSIQLSTKLRDEGINNTVYLEDVKFKTKLNYVVKSQINFALFVGEDEIKNNVYTIKNLQTFEQKQVSFEELIEILK